MYTLAEFRVATRVIVHFAGQEGMATFPYYQVLIDPTKDELWSPSGEFYRFNHGEESELHGWVRIDSLVIDEVLEQMEEEVVNG